MIHAIDSEYSDALLKHMAIATSQYDEVCRALASEVLRLREANVRAAVIMGERNRTTPIVTFTVHGEPQQQGSGRAFTYRRTAEKGGGFGARIDHDNPKLKQWRKHVSLVARSLYRGPAVEGALSIAAWFSLTRPKTVRRLQHTVAPDLDKLVRSIGDALTGIVYVDDAQIVEWHARKHYVAAGESPCAIITVTAVTDEGMLFHAKSPV